MAIRLFKDGSFFRAALEHTHILGFKSLFDPTKKLYLKVFSLEQAWHEKGTLYSGHRYYGLGDFVLGKHSVFSTDPRNVFPSEQGKQRSKKELLRAMTTVMLGECLEALATPQSNDRLSDLADTYFDNQVSWNLQTLCTLLSLDQLYFMLGERLGTKLSLPAFLREALIELIGNRPNLSIFDMLHEADPAWSFSYRLAQSVSKDSYEAKKVVGKALEKAAAELFEINKAAFRAAATGGLSNALKAVFHSFDEKEQDEILVSGLQSLISAYIGALSVSFANIMVTLYEDTQGKALKECDEARLTELFAEAISANMPLPVAPRESLKDLEQPQENRETLWLQPLGEFEQSRLDEIAFSERDSDWASKNYAFGMGKHRCVAMGYSIHHALPSLVKALARLPWHLEDDGKRVGTIIEQLEVVKGLHRKWSFHRD